MPKTVNTAAAPPRVLYPGDLLERFRISHSTRWHWERKGILPPRDFPKQGRRMGWLRETIEAWETGSPCGAPAQAGEKGKARAA